MPRERNRDREVGEDDTEILEDYCPHCGQYTGGDSICPNCGSEIFNDSGLVEHDEDEGNDDI